MSSKLGCGEVRPFPVSPHPLGRGETGAGTGGGRREGKGEVEGR